MNAPDTVIPVPASTIVLLRDGAEGPEVLMLRRPLKDHDASSGAWVFPGGRVDDDDRGFDAALATLDDVAASRRLGMESGGLGWLVAAVRECVEECGLLLAVDAQGLAIDGDAVSLPDGGAGFVELCRERGWRLDVDRLAYLSHWLTPLGMARRFDTRFFVARAPAGAVPQCGAGEVMDHCWLRPADALRPDSGLALPHPTRRTLMALSAFAGVDEMLTHVRSQPEVQRVAPRLAQGANGRTPVMPDEPAYAEIGRIDPHGHGQASSRLLPGQAVRLSNHVVRVTAPNANAMTGPGTNSYFIGAGDQWALLDPGPDDEAHVQALHAAMPGPVRWILTTHTHKDHSPAAAPLRAASGARLLGRIAVHPAGQDPHFAPDEEVAHGRRLAIAPGVTLRALHTPGHASNHVCWLFEEEKTLFTGDHVMQGSSVVISPPDGDMAQYVAALEALLDEDLHWLAPGHGFLMDRPHDVVRGRIRHRLLREAKVARVLESVAQSMDALTERVYDDVPRAMWPVARRSLLAHLLKLEAEGRARRSGEDWRAA